MCSDGTRSVTKRDDVHGHVLVTVQGMCMAYVDRYVLQGKIEFSVRTAGFTMRKLNFTDLLSTDDYVVTDEDVKAMEDVLEKEKIPDGLRVKHMWSLFKHYNTSKWWQDIMIYGLLAVAGVVAIMIGSYVVNRLCQGKVSSSASRTGVGNFKFFFNTGTQQTDNKANTEEGQGEEMVTFSPDSSRQERSTSMSGIMKYVPLKTPQTSRRLINEMNWSKDEKRRIVNAYERLRAAEGIRTYATESESESESEPEPEGEKTKDKMVTFEHRHGGRCRSCVKEVCECVDDKGMRMWHRFCQTCDMHQNICNCDKGFVPKEYPQFCKKCDKNKYVCKCVDGFDPKGEPM